MSLTLKEELRRTFELATLRREAQDIKTPRQWAQANDLITRSRNARERETRLYSERYDMRIEAARRRLVDNAGTPTRMLRPGWIGRDRFDAADLLRQAQRDVRAHHDRRIGRIMEAETRALAGLVRQAALENALQGTVCVAFKRAADLHRGPKQPKNTGPARY